MRAMLIDVGTQPSMRIVELHSENIKSVHVCTYALMPVAFYAQVCIHADRPSPITNRHVGDRHHLVTRLAVPFGAQL